MVDSCLVLSMHSNCVDRSPQDAGVRRRRQAQRQQAWLIRAALSGPLSL